MSKLEEKVNEILGIEKEVEKVENELIEKHGNLQNEEKTLFESLNEKYGEGWRNFWKEKAKAWAPPRRMICTPI